jgi:hypothetical protein
MYSFQKKLAERLQCGSNGKENIMLRGVATSGHSVLLSLRLLELIVKVVFIINVICLYHDREHFLHWRRRGSDRSNIVGLTAALAGRSAGSTFARNASRRLCRWRGRNGCSGLIRLFLFRHLLVLSGFRIGWNQFLLRLFFRHRIRLLARFLNKGSLGALNQNGPIEIFQCNRNRSALLHADTDGTTRFLRDLVLKFCHLLVSVSNKEVLLSPCCSRSLFVKVPILHWPARPALKSQDRTQA